jgi:hypothetical protein
MILGIVFVPPEGSKYSSPESFLEIEHDFHKFSCNSYNVCLMGDFNARVGSLPDYFTVDDFFNE